MTAPRPREEVCKGAREQFFAQPFDQRIRHRPRVQHGEINTLRRRRDFLRAQIRQRRGRDLDRQRLQRHGRVRVVGRVVIARLIDREELHHPEALLRRPVHQLAQRPRVADSEIALSVQGEKRDEQTGERFIG